MVRRWNQNQLQIILLSLLYTKCSNLYQIEKPLVPIVRYVYDYTKNDFFLYLEWVIFSYDTSIDLSRERLLVIGKNTVHKWLIDFKWSKAN